MTAVGPPVVRHGLGVEAAPEFDLIASVPPARAREEGLCLLVQSVAIKAVNGLAA